MHKTRVLPDKELCPDRRRNGFVVIAMEAMDQLLVACHAQTLNLFIESFLKMVQKLLESTDPQLQILATQSVSDNHWRINITVANSIRLTCRLSVCQICQHRGRHTLVSHSLRFLCVEIFGNVSF